MRKVIPITASADKGPIAPPEGADAEMVSLYEAHKKIYPRSVSGLFSRWRWGLELLVQSLPILHPESCRPESSTATIQLTSPPARVPGEIRRTGSLRIISGPPSPRRKKPTSICSSQDWVGSPGGRRRSIRRPITTKPFSVSSAQQNRPPTRVTSSREATSSEPSSITAELWG